MPETVIRPAFPAQEIALDYIERHHEHLLDAKIQWLFTSAKRTRGGHVVLGSAGRQNPLQRFQSSGNESVQSGYDFVVQIEEKRWQVALATQRHALVDHLLCSMIRREHVNNRTGNVTYSWGIRGPEINEFTEVFERHGVWLPEQQKMAGVVRAGKQLKLKLPDVKGDVDEPESTSSVRSSPDEPDRRVTTVDAEGTVVDSALLREAKASVRLDGETHAFEPTAGELLEVDPPATNGHGGPTWQESTGTGTSELAQHRARRSSRRAGAMTEMAAVAGDTGSPS